MYLVRFPLTSGAENAARSEPVALPCSAFSSRELVKWNPQILIATAATIAARESPRIGVGHVLRVNRRDVQMAFRLMRSFGDHVATAID